MTGREGVVQNARTTVLASASGALADESAFNGYHFSCFIATETAVTIVPRFSLPRVECLGGVYGPFEPNYPVDVPLWLALHLRLTDTCTITPPLYLRIPFLRNVLAREQASGGDFEALPFYFYEVAKKLCETGSSGAGVSSSPTGAGGGGRAADDIPHLAEVVRLVHEIRAVRQRKLKQSMGVFEPEGSAMLIPGIRLTHIISGELHFLRTSFAVVLRQACEMERRRAMPMAYLTVGGGAGRAAARLPYVATTPAAAAGRGVTPGLSSATPTTAVGTAGHSTVASLDRDGRVDTTATASTTTPDAVSAVVGLPTDSQMQSTQLSTTATSVSSPIAQPPVKKRRTLRQM